MNDEKIQSPEKEAILTDGMDTEKETLVDPESPLFLLILFLHAR